MSRKPYSHVLYKRNDPKAKKLMIDFAKKYLELDLIEFSESNTKNKYAPDLVTPDFLLYMEVEHREKNWKRGKFPYPTVHVWKRKDDDYDLKSWDNLVMAQFSKDWSTMCILLPKYYQKYIQPEYLVTVKNIYSDENEDEHELAFDVPKGCWIWYDVETGGIIEDANI